MPDHNSYWGPHTGWEWRWVSQREEKNCWEIWISSGFLRHLEFVLSLQSRILGTASCSSTMGCCVPSASSSTQWISPPTCTPSRASHKLHRVEHTPPGLNCLGGRQLVAGGVTQQSCPDSSLRRPCRLETAESTWCEPRIPLSDTTWHLK